MFTLFSGRRVGDVHQPGGSILGSVKFVQNISTDIYLKFRKTYRPKTWTSILLIYLGIQYYFQIPRKVDGEEFLSQISTLKTVPSDKKSNCRTCAKGCQMPSNC